jgi:glucose/arabinose dehydrogenase
MVTFGPDGYLYLGLGDGGSGGDPHGNGQSLSSLLGKILRIDVDHGDPYAIPGDNPYTEGRGQPEIWAYGLRNPWRFSFDHLTGDLYIGDVGQNLWEEIDFLPAGSLGGANFGWNFFEGTHTYQATVPEGLSVVAPIFEYSHDMGCSVTGGVVYRGALLPEWQGVYLYGDYCTGRVWGARRIAQGDWLNALLFEGIGQITSFGEDEAGEVYLADQAGIIYTLTGK